MRFFPSEYYYIKTGVQGRLHPPFIDALYITNAHTIKAQKQKLPTMIHPIKIKILSAHLAGAA